MGRITVASAKAKGRALQDWTCAQVSRATGLPWGREDEKEIQPRAMGQNGTDIALRGEARKLFPFAVECKSGEHWSIKDAIRQAKANQGTFPHWLVVLKDKSMKSPIAIVDGGLFFDLWELAVKELSRNDDSQGIIGKTEEKR